MTTYNEGEDMKCIFLLNTKINNTIKYYILDSKFYSTKKSKSATMKKISSVKKVLA